MAGNRNKQAPLLIDGDSENVEVIDFFTDDMDTTSTDAQAKVEAMSAALRDDPEAFLNIGKLSGKGSNMPEEFCARIPADKYDIGQLQEYIANTFGAGDYRVRLYSKGKVRGNKLVTIASRITASDIKSAQGDTASILETVLARMEAQNRQMMQLLAQQQPAQNRTEMLNEMLLYKQLFTSDRPASSGGIGQIQETLSLLKEIGVNIGGQSEEKEDGFSSMLEKLAPLAVSLMQQKPAQNTLPAPSQLPQRQQVKSNPIQPTEQKSTMNIATKMALKTGVAMLVKAAAKNSDQMTYGEMLLDQIPVEILTQHITAPNAIETLCSHFPEIVPHKEWFVTLGEHIKAQLGMASTVSDLYDSLEDDINEDTLLADPIDNDANLSTSSNP